MGRIPVNFVHGRGLLFDAEDYLKLRFEHRIVGNLIGVPVSHPRNTNQQGMPVALTLCELQLLLEKQIIELVDKNVILLAAPTTEQFQLYSSMIARQKEEMCQPVIEKKLEAFQKHLPRILEGKRRKLLKSGIKGEDIHLTAEQLLAEERQRINQEKFDTLVQVPTNYPLRQDASSELHLVEDVKYRAFRSLWSQGGFITTGDAFGCDFLLYPGDPMYFHASHMVHVLKNGAHQRLDVKYMIRMCRLSVVVNKLCVIAYVDEESNELRFETLEWEGNVNKGDNLQ